MEPKVLFELTKVDLHTMVGVLSEVLDQHPVGTTLIIDTIVDEAVTRAQTMPDTPESVKKATRMAWRITLSAKRADFMLGTNNFECITSMDVLNDGSVTLKSDAPDGFEQNYKPSPRIPRGDDTYPN